jgi:hypothetical protein
MDMEIGYGMVLLHSSRTIPITMYQTTEKPSTSMQTERKANPADHTY